MENAIAEALLGENGNDEAIYSLFEGYEAWEAARRILEALTDNEDVNGPGTYASWTDAAHVIDAYDGLGEAFEALPQEHREIAYPLIVAGVERALGILKEYGHLGDRALVLADEKMRLEDPEFRAKAREAIEEELKAAARDAENMEGSAWADFGDCQANEGMSVVVNGIDLGFEYRMPQDWVSSLAREGFDEDEWEALSDVERGELEHKALVAQIRDARAEGGDVDEMWHQVEVYRDGLRSELETELSHLRYLHDEENREAA